MKVNVAGNLTSSADAQRVNAIEKVMPAIRAGASMTSPRRMCSSHRPRICGEDILFEKIMSSRSGEGNAVPQHEESVRQIVADVDIGMCNAEQRGFFDDIVRRNASSSSRRWQARHPPLPLHRLDHDNVVAIRGRRSNLRARYFDALCEVGDDLNFWHAIAFLLSRQNE